MSPIATDRVTVGIQKGRRWKESESLSKEILEHVDPRKDVDGLHSQNIFKLFTKCTSGYLHLPFRLATFLDIATFRFSSIS